MSQYIYHIPTKSIVELKYKQGVVPIMIINAENMPMMVKNGELSKTYQYDNLNNALCDFKGLNELFTEDELELILNALHFLNRSEPLFRKVYKMFNEKNYEYHAYNTLLLQKEQLLEEQNLLLKDKHEILVKITNKLLNYEEAQKRWNNLSWYKKIWYCIRKKEYNE